MSKVLILYNEHGRGAELGSAHGSVLEPLNFTTEFVAHKKHAHNKDNRFDSAWFKQSAVLKQKH